MCLAVPAKIIELEGVNAIVELNGVKRQANVAFIEDAAIGDHVLLHAGFAIRKWDQEGVQEYNDIMEGIGGPEMSGRKQD